MRETRKISLMARLAECDFFLGGGAGRVRADYNNVATMDIGQYGHIGQAKNGWNPVPDVYRDPLGDDKLSGGEEFEHAQ